MAAKTNAVRLVQQALIPCREFFYEYDENDLNGNHAAVALGFPPEQVFKTLVARGERSGIHVFCIPVCCELDLKKAAKAAGDKSMELVFAAIFHHRKTLYYIFWLLASGNREKLCGLLAFFRIVC